MNKIILCGRGKCCPTVEKIKTGFVVKDDFNGEVELTDEQMDLLQNADLSKLKTDDLQEL